MNVSNEIKLVDINKLVPYARNARTHSEEQIKQIQASIREFGFINPLLIDKDFNIIAGHGRVLAAKAEGLEKVPCIPVEHLTEAQKKAYIIADNKLALNAGWDLEMLKIEIEDLQEMDFDIDIIGFSDIELGDLFVFNDECDNQEIQEDNYDVELPEEAITKLGDIFCLGRHRLMCGDSTKQEDVLNLMNGKLAQAVFTDPPWNVNYGAVEEGNAQGYKPRTIMNDFMGTEDFKQFMDSAFSNMYLALQEGGMVYVVMSAQEWGNMMLTLAKNDFHWSSTIIWNKDRLVLSRKDYHTKYEPIWYGWKSAPRLRPLEDRKQTDVWDIERPSNSDLHPTMKPLELVARALKNSSKKNDLILDLFGGSGTTLIVSEQLERTCYMMELDPKYCDVIIDRWEDFTGQKAVLLNE